MSKSIVAGIDIDGVLYDYHDAFYEFYKCEFGYEGTKKELWTRDFNNLSTERQRYLISIPIPYDISVPSEEIKSFLEELTDVADDVYYLTHRSGQEMERITRRYFRRYGFPFQDNLIFSHDKAVDCTRYGVTHFIDDFPNNVVPVSRVCNSYLKDAIHNKEKQEGFNVIHRLSEFIDAIKGEQNV